MPASGMHAVFARLHTDAGMQEWANDSSCSAALAGLFLDSSLDFSSAGAHCAVSLYHSASQSNQHTAQTDFIYARSLAESVVGVTCRAAFS